MLSKKHPKTHYRDSESRGRRFAEGIPPSMITRQFNPCNPHLPPKGRFPVSSMWMSNPQEQLMVCWTPSMSTWNRWRPWSIPAAKPLQSAAFMAEYSLPVKMREDLFAIGVEGKQVWIQWQVHQKQHRLMRLLAFWFLFYYYLFLIDYGQEVES